MSPQDPRNSARSEPYTSSLGTDIDGIIEVRPITGTAWSTAAPLADLYAFRSYDAFGCLFGVRNDAGFTPIAAARGLPADLGPDAPGLAAIGEDPTWVTWGELAAVDWGEPAARIDDRIHRYRRTVDGVWAPDGKSAYSSELAALVGQEREIQAGSRHPEGTTWEVGEVLYRAERLRRRDAVLIDRQWRAVFDLMRELSAIHGDGGVRLVVWFDS